MKKIFSIILCIVALLSCFAIPSFAEENESDVVVPAVDTGNGIYYDCYDLVSNYIYGGVVDTPEVNLVCTLLASFLSILVVALPFVIVWFVIKLILSVGVRLL